MDRETLAYMLKSGKFLCYNPGALDTRVQMAVGEDAAGLTELKDTEDQPTPLFDSPFLTNAVFFKEASEDEHDGLSVSTRAMFTFNEANAVEGGASVIARPDFLEAALLKWYGGKADIVFSDHDKNILDVFCTIPTFDPFLLLARRQDLERERGVDPDNFSVDIDTAGEVRSLINGRATSLVKLAMGDAKSPDKVTATIKALSESIWNCRADRRTGHLFKSLGIPKDRTSRILFAWKGVAYYEYLFQSFAEDYSDFLDWLRGPDSMPKDLGTVQNDRSFRIEHARKAAQVVMRRYYSHATEVLKKHNDAYDALLLDGNPEPFQKFLHDAPRLFETLGLCIGCFGHASNAWKTLTNNGRRRKRKANALEEFYRFINGLSAGGSEE